eukprot:223817-Chlamydomonas_euryale.AAC.5
MNLVRGCRGTAHGVASHTFHVVWTPGQGSSVRGRSVQPCTLLVGCSCRAAGLLRCRIVALQGCCGASVQCNQISPPLPGTAAAIAAALARGVKPHAVRAAAP